MDYKKFVIYYFSGTGNSRNVALWMADVAAENGIEPEIINLTTTDRLNIKKPPEEALLIFVSPVHGFNYPPVMLHFVARFPKGKNQVLLMNTRAGMLIGKWITPGLSGISFYFSSLLLKLKGYSIRGMVSVDLPSNWISLHPGLRKRAIEFLHIKNKERVRDCALKLISGKTNFKSVREIAQDLLISPIALLYYFIGRFALAKTFYASADCNKCNLCIQQCPVKAIIEIDKRPYWTFNCESCMKCMSNCPQKAIETSHGFTIGLVVLLKTALLGLFYYYFSLFFFEIENKTVKFALPTIIYFSLLTIAYRLVHYAMRFKIVERIMVYTSLTKYKFWGQRYKALKENNVKKNTDILPAESK